MELWEQLFLPDKWQEFFAYKTEKQHLSGTEQKNLEEYIHNRIYLSVLSSIAQKGGELPLPYKKEINKNGVSKKRIVYSFPNDFNMLLKMLAFLLYRYDYLFSNNCYAFRRNYCAKEALRRIQSIPNLSRKYCLKVDISNYFNSVNIPVLLDKLSFLQAEDVTLYAFLQRLLTADCSIICNDNAEQLIYEKRGAMAGTPISPFLANVYLMDVDEYFAKKNIRYFRYSDDILLFADTQEELETLQGLLYDRIAENHLQLNPSKVYVTTPGNSFDFLGFRFYEKQVDLSLGTLQKIKGKIKRKAHALRRWQKKKALPPERAAKGFIKAMNRKFYDSGDGTDFSWSRWFFPCLTTDIGLREIDSYMQQYIRYCVTGRHYKGNFKISYEQMKQWGYRSLVHEYYEMHRGTNRTISPDAQKVSLSQ